MWPAEVRSGRGSILPRSLGNWARATSGFVFEKKKVWQSRRLLQFKLQAPRLANFLHKGKPQDLSHAEVQISVFSLLERSTWQLAMNSDFPSELIVV